MKRIVPVIIAIFFFPCLLPAQDFSYVQFTEKDGLPSDIVYDLCQDSDGFMWFATENGVCRYDGTHFKTFTTADGLPDNAILKVFYSNSGKIWVTPFMHCPYYFYKDRFYPIDISDEDKTLLANVIQFTDIDTNLAVTIEFGGRGHYYLVHDKKVKQIKDVYKHFPEGGYLSSYGKNRITAFNNDSFFFKKGNEFVFTLLRDPALYATDLDQNGNFRFVPLPPLDVFTPSTTMLNGKYFFVSKGDSIFLFSKLTGELQIRIGLRKPSNGVVDTEDGFWMATLGHGVFRYPSLAFRHLFYDKDAPGIYSFAKYAGEVLAGDGYGRLINAKNGKVWNDYSPFIRMSGNKPAQVSRQNRIYKQFTYNDVLFTGTDAFIVRQAPDGQTIMANYYPVKDVDAAGDKLLVCLGSRALILNNKTLQEVETIINQRTTAGIIVGSNYYLGTVGGLVKVDAATKTVTKLSHLDPALAQRITAIIHTSGDTIWVLTSGAGLLALKNDKIVYHITKSNGLTSDLCTSIFADGEILWVGTDRGLNKISFNAGKHSVIQISRSDGLAFNTVNAVFADSTTVYVAGPLGLNSFTKAYIKEQSQCLFHLMGAMVNDNRLPLDSVYHFNYDALNIRFDFVGISYKSAGEINYYYKLDGLDNKWNFTSNTYINFPTLQPGSYTLSLKAVNKFGVESQVRTVRIVISPPWWKTWWFIALLAILLAGIVFYMYQRRVRSIIREENEKRQLQSQFAALEQQALQAQMNPHFIFNCLNSIQSFVIKQDVEGANRYLTGFASLIRQTLDNSSEDLISLADEIKYIETYLMLEKARHDEKFVYHVNTETTIDIHAFLMPAMLLQPYVENAIRHGIQHRPGNGGEITVTFTGKPGGKLFCRITDNGLGRKKTEELKSKQHIEYMSKGTAITEKRIAMLKLQYGKEINTRTKDIVNEKGEVCGTAIELEFSDFSGLNETP